jgi:hypothetical protein
MPALATVVSCSPLPPPTSTPPNNTHSRKKVRPPGRRASASQGGPPPRRANRIPGKDINTEDFESAPWFACRKTRRTSQRFCVRVLRRGNPTESRGCVKIAELTTFATHGSWARYGRFKNPKRPFVTGLLGLPRLFRVLGFFLTRVGRSAAMAVQINRMGVIDRLSQGASGKP